MRAALITLSLCAAACSESVPVGTDRPGERIEGLSEDARGRFLLGRALFEREATPEEGLGPLFNAERCSSCHDVPAVGGSGIRVPVLKATRDVNGQCSLLVGMGGDNIQQQATPQLLAAGVGPEEVPADATASAFVMAPPLFGLGLLESISEGDLARLEDPEDRDGDGISGRPARFADGRIARFGRKGDAATVEAFVRTALRFELGFTTSDHPAEETRNGTPVPAATDPMRDPEMDDGTVALLTDYVRFLAPLAPATPPPGSAADSVRRGEALFEQVGCTSCHTPEWTTGSAAEPALAGRVIRPYTDLLLHDLGGAEGDVCTPQAQAGEYRTTPLWGLRFQTVYWHDGRAGTLTEALALHGGEAEGVMAAYRGLSDGQKADLLRFLAGL